MVITAILMISLRDHIGYIFVNDKDVAAVVAVIAPVAALFQLADGFQGVSSGVQRGLGRQKTVAIINFFGFWVVALPLGFVLCFYGDGEGGDGGFGDYYGGGEGGRIDGAAGVLGIWIGLAVGLFLVACFHGFSLFIFTDWSKITVYRSADIDALAKPTRDPADENTSLLSASSA